jgi:mono/diheme cytochrome c family protein
MLADQDYLDRFGFMRDEEAAEPLPIGFAHGGPAENPDGTAMLNPQSGKPMTAIGLTCAACHTGRLTYNGVEIRIDGAPALANLKLFQSAIGTAAFETLEFPPWFDRFAGRVLGPDATDAARTVLKVQLKDVLSHFKEISDLEDSVKNASVQEGYGRLDALNRIGNTVFALDLGGAWTKQNYAPTSAPVHFPRIWDAPWFLWVQYDGSIEQPMVRNAGEALGVSAPVTLHGAAGDLFRSDVPVDVLYRMEHMLAGSQPTANTGFTGLRAPRWPSATLPPIDTALAAKGEQLYAAICQGCHLAPVSQPAFWSSSRWTSPNAAGESYLDVEMVPITHVGTDPAQASGLANRRVAVPPELGISETSFGPALGQFVDKVVTKYYDTRQPPVPPADRERMDGNRPNDIRAPLAYKARPLDGIWATPPYLHNGSVPSLYDLLSPISERPTLIYLGSHEFDPVKVGLKVDKFPGAVPLDVTQPGNHATGHEFSDTPGPGIVGRYLTPDERRALVEYLKTL